MDKEENLYNQINQYYKFADELNTEITKSNDVVSINDKAKILLPMIDDLKTTADQLIENYIKCLKDKGNHILMDNLKQTLNELIEKIDKCKNKIYELYK